MYDTKKLYKFGSTDEAIAIYVINRNRSAKLFEAVIGVAAPDKVSKLFQQYKGILFPEEKYDELAYIKKSQDYMKKMRDFVIYARPVRAKKT